MFGIGTWEWVLIIIIGLVFLGPDKLPEVARSAGKGMRAVRRALRGLEEEVGPITRPLADLDPRRVFEDAVREQTSPQPDKHPDTAGARDESELAPEDLAAPEPAAPEAAGPTVEADGRVSSGPPLPAAGPRPAPGPPATAAPVQVSSEGEGDGEDGDEGEEPA